MTAKLHTIGFMSLVCLLCSLLCGAGAYGQLYVCKGKNGRISYTNAPVNSTCEPYKSKNSMSVTARVTMEEYVPSSISTYDIGSSLAYDEFIQGAGYRYSVDPDLIKAIIKVESGFNRYAVSRVGAQGLMQLMPETQKDLKVSDPFDPMQNIYGGTQYMRDLLKMFGGDVKLALAAYNAGPTNVKKYKGIPRFPETIRYVDKVLSHYKRYKGLYSKNEGKTKKIIANSIISSGGSAITINELRVASSR